MILENKLVPSGKAFDEYRNLDVGSFYYVKSEGEESTNSDPDQAAENWVLSAMATITSIHLLDVKPGHRILDIGSGSGYTSALLARLSAPNGKVIALELDSEVINHSKKVITEFCSDVEKNIEFKNVDGSFGFKDFAPYDSIFVGGCVNTLPKEWFDQLKVGGKMVVAVSALSPEKTPIQVLRRISKSNDVSYTIDDIMDVDYEMLNIR